MRRMLLLLLSLALLCTGCAAQAPLTTELDIVYGRAGDTDLLLDSFRPNDERVLPAVIFIHGGGWAAGSRADYRDMAKGLAAQGYVCFSIDYRLVKPAEAGRPVTNPWPAPFDDCQRAVRWVRAHADRFKLDAKHVGVLGGSAGGHLVACLGTMDTRDNSDADLAGFSSRPEAVVDISGPTDFAVDIAPEGSKDAGWVKVVTQNLLQGKPRDQAAELIREASPIYHIDAKTSPMLIFHGKADTIVNVDQAVRFDAALRQAGRDVKLYAFDGEGHGFGQKANVETFIRETVAFFGRLLKAAPAAQ
ncbi:MAG: alpha/beta hydrolase [Armatimonadetes bacterium]|nr:alpha/beta hydrolase [Armatimonadota bacterium]